MDKLRAGELVNGRSEQERTTKRFVAETTDASTTMPRCGKVASVDWSTGSSDPLKWPAHRPFSTTEGDEISGTNCCLIGLVGSMATP